MSLNLQNALLPARVISWVIPSLRSRHAHKIHRTSKIVSSKFRFRLKMRMWTVVMPLWPDDMQMKLALIAIEDSRLQHLAHCTLYNCTMHLHMWHIGHWTLDMDMDMDMDIAIDIGI
jgi:hypothetical protein